MPLINRDSDYAVRALAQLSRNGDVTPVSVLARAEDVPVDFLKKIMQKLHHAGLVDSHQGPFGGYSLSRRPEDISLLEVLHSVQGPLVLNRCFAEPPQCGGAAACGLRKRLEGLQDKLEPWLAGITLAEIVGSTPEKEGAVP
ncbi:MAG: Rrf2 family transcriptional regulator [Candidatus Brocadiia bacterium]|jgi:Rrf2 family protein|nr:Rrf2 family transcriptional regulator [Candidatus Brocadiia bacterium]